MNQPPNQPWPPSAPSAPSSITVGGPNGVVIHGDRVQVGGMVVNPGTPTGTQVPGVAQVAQVPRASQHGGASLEMELFRNPRRLPRLMMGGGLLFGLMAVVMAIPAMGVHISVSVMASIMALAAICAGFVLKQKAMHAASHRALPPELELGLLALAKRHGGELCVPDTALELQIPLDEAQEALERLAKRGHAELEVKEGGEMVYKILQGSSRAPNALPAGSQ